MNAHPTLGLIDMSVEEDFHKTWIEYHDVLHSELNTPDSYPNKRPLLAHYTSLENVEKILRSEQVWLSNPLLMNDLEEVRFGVLSGMEIVRSNERLSVALREDTRRKIFFDAIETAFEKYGNDDVTDLYVVCFSLHEAHNTDGILSMWRGYGNRGKGAAIVFDTAKLPVPENTPLVLEAVSYASKDERKNKITQKIDAIADFISVNFIPDEYLHAIADALFKRICLFAIFSKHIGFLEEAEWRLVYFKDRDKSDASDDNSSLLFERYFSYFNGPDGIQPKLKLPIGEYLSKVGSEMSFSNIVERIIVGPTVSSPLAKKAVERMLRDIGKDVLIEKVKYSEIPFRGP